MYIPYAIELKWMNSKWTLSDLTGFSQLESLHLQFCTCKTITFIHTVASRLICNFLTEEKWLWLQLSHLLYSRKSFLATYRVSQNVLHSAADYSRTNFEHGYGAFDKACFVHVLNFSSKLDFTYIIRPHKHIHAAYIHIPLNV